MRNHNTLTRPQIIEEVAKCVPQTCKVDLENPEVFILIEIFKVRALAYHKARFRSDALSFAERLWYGRRAGLLSVAEVQRHGDR